MNLITSLIWILLTAFILWNIFYCFYIQRWTKVFAGIVYILTLQKSHVQLDMTRRYRGRIFEILYFVNFWIASENRQRNLDKKWMLHARNCVVRSSFLEQILHGLRSVRFLNFPRSIDHANLQEIHSNCGTTLRLLIQLSFVEAGSSSVEISFHILSAVFRKIVLHNT